MSICKRHKWSGGDKCLRCGITRFEFEKEKANQAISALVGRPVNDIEEFFQSQGENIEEAE